MTTAEEDVLFSMQKKKMFVSQSREVRGQKEEAELFTLKQQELAGLFAAL